MQSIVIPEEFIKFAIEVIDNDVEGDSKKNREFIETYKRELHSLARKNDKLMEMKLGDLIDEEEFKSKRSE
ncbi:MAG: hypothetical protein IPH11_15760 [Ignavibacteriales bacterium]|nr:hypothetical protein [Ignavibacteriales bacterium]